MQLTANQQIRLIHHKTAFGRYMLEGTLVHCCKLFTSGMICEAIEVLSDFTGKDEQTCYNELLINIEKEKLTPCPNLV